MPGSNGQAAGPLGESRSRRAPLLSPRAQIDLAAVACLVAGLLAVLSAFTPWWYATTSSLGTSSTALFYPGSNLYAGGGGGGGTTTYANSGLPSVGGLYLSVLAGAIALALLAWLVAGHSLGLARGKWSSLSVRRAARFALLAAVVLSAFLAFAVPVAQPALYRADNPAGSCSSAAPPGVCGSFWGTSSGPAGTSSWGAGLGWWLDLTSAVLLGLAVALGTVAVVPRPMPEVSPAGSRAGPVASAETSPLSLGELQRLAELKWLSDSGQVAPEAFLEAKRRLLRAAPSPGLAGPGPRTPLPSEELSILKSLHDSGALTDDEYHLLERRALLWI